jgi:DNA-binding response OmpR family regulator
VHLPTRQGTCGGRLLSLTALEFDLLAYFIAHAGEALGRERLLADVWGYDIGGLETVTVHVRRLRKKIESDPSRPLMLETVWGVGYRLALGADESAAAFARSG